MTFLTLKDRQAIETIKGWVIYEALGAEDFQLQTQIKVHKTDSPHLVVIFSIPTRDITQYWCVSNSYEHAKEFTETFHRELEKSLNCSSQQWFGLEKFN
jgi:hypothetical protein